MFPSILFFRSTTLRYPLRENGAAGHIHTAVRRAAPHSPTGVRGVLAFTWCSALGLIQNQNQNQNIYCPRTILQGNLSYGAQ